MAMDVGFMSAQLHFWEFSETTTGQTLLTLLEILRRLSHPAAYPNCDSLYCYH